MADETRKIAHLVGTAAQGAAGGGRKGLLMHDTDIGTLKMQLNAEGTYAIYARRNAAQTFTGKQTFTDASFTALAGGGASPLPVARNDAGGLVPRTASEARSDIGISASDGQIVHAGPDGILRSDAGLTYARTGGITSAFQLGNGSVQASVQSRIRRTSGFYGAVAFADPSNKIRWQLAHSDSGDTLRITARDATETAIDEPVVIPNAVGSAIVIGGAHATTKRDANFTGNVSVGSTADSSSLNRRFAVHQYSSAAGGGEIYLGSAGVSGDENSGKIFFGGSGRIIGRTDSDRPLRLQVGNSTSSAWESIIGLGASNTVNSGLDIMKGPLRIAATQRISSVGRFDASSVYSTSWQGTGVRPLAADAAGQGYVPSAATFMSSALGISAFAQTILDDADAAAVRTTIGAVGVEDARQKTIGTGFYSVDTSSTPVLVCAPVATSGVFAAPTTGRNALRYRFRAAFASNPGTVTIDLRRNGTSIASLSGACATGGGVDVEYQFTKTASIYSQLGPVSVKIGTASWVQSFSAVGLDSSIDNTLSIYLSTTNSSAGNPFCWSLEAI